MQTLYGDYETKSDLNTETFDHYFELCRPKTSTEKWTEIPWISNLWEARQKSAAEMRPMFLWAMNGHPFGCV